MIPKTVHYVWVGPNPVPEADRTYIAHWQTVMPDWTFTCWNNDNVDFSAPYLRQAYAARAWNRVSDYVRMDVLAKFGGVYLDTDVELVHPLDPLLHYPAFLGFQVQEDLHPDLVNGAVLGAVAGHWLPSLIRDRFNMTMDGRVDTDSYSGPGMLSEVLRSRGLSGYSERPVEIDGVHVFPTRYFYPYHWEEEFDRQRIGPDTIAIHHWAKSWGSAPGRMKRIRRKIIAIMARHTPDLALAVARRAAARGH